MKFKKCPECGLNYIPVDEELCVLCKEKTNPPKMALTRRVATELPQIDIVRHNGRAVFYVFQNIDMFSIEAHEGYLIAPREGKNGHVPHHWYRLKEVKPGDVVIHGVGGYICAISIAQGNCFESQYEDGRKAWKVNCKYYLLRKPLVVNNYKEIIIRQRSHKQFQPFNKNGTGNQGYLFDIDRTLAKFFVEEAAKCNKNLTSINELKWLME